MTTLAQHQTEILRNQTAWQNKPLLRTIYKGFYDQILDVVDLTLLGRVLEIGSGIGNLKSRLPQAICSDLFPNPWLDLVCDGYELPFTSASLSHLILFDVFHHFEAPRAFLREARRVLMPMGRLIIFEPYISLLSYPAYEWFHHEPVAWRDDIHAAESLPRPRRYYAAQGNATRIFFRREHPDWLDGWSCFHAEAFASFAYLLSGGFSKPALYSSRLLPILKRLDVFFAGTPRIWGARCLFGLRKIEY